MVSVWVGHFKSPDQLDEYMNLTSGFEDDFGFTLDEKDVREATVEVLSKSIDQLADGFSAFESFVGNVAEAATRAGIRSATTMLVCYGFEFDPSRVAVNDAAPLRFLGAFPFS